MLQNTQRCAEQNTVYAKGVFCNTPSLTNLSRKGMSRAGARALIGGCIFIYSGSARLVSFVIKLILKEISRAEPEYMNIHPPSPN